MRVMKKFSAYLILGGIGLFFLMLLSAPVWGTSNSGNTRVCFCHNVNNNPHTICTSNVGQIQGHMRHVNNGEDYQGECRVPPTPTPTATPTPKDCKISPTPTPTEQPTPTPTLDLTPSPTATPSVQPTVTSTPTPTPTATTTPEPTKNDVSSTVQSTSTGPATAPKGDDCPIGMKPPANIYVDTGAPNDGKVEVRWTPGTSLPYAHIQYWRYDTPTIQYSLLETDNDGVEEIGMLTNGVNWAFRVAEVSRKGGGACVGSWSDVYDPMP